MFAENVKLHIETGVFSTIDGNTFYLFKKNTWIVDSGVSSLFNVIDINKSIQGSSDNM